MFPVAVAWFDVMQTAFGGAVPTQPQSKRAVVPNRAIERVIH